MIAKLFIFTVAMLLIPKNLQSKESLSKCPDGEISLSGECLFSDSSEESNKIDDDEKVDDDVSSDTPNNPFLILDRAFQKPLFDGELKMLPVEEK